MPVTYDEPVPIGLRQTAITLVADYIEREFQHWHLLPLDGALETVPLADVEVAGLVELDLDDAFSLAADEVETVPARFASCGEHGPAYSDGTLSRAELVPTYLALDQLYLRLFITASRYCAGERTHLFW